MTFFYEKFVEKTHFLFLSEKNLPSRHYLSRKWVAYKLYHLLILVPVFQLQTFKEIAKKLIFAFSVVPVARLSE